MAELLGERALPDSVQNQRERLRSQLEDLRDPIRSRRVSTVPGPDLIGRGEEAITDARRRVITRDSPIGGILSRITGDDSEDGGNSGGSGGSNGGNSSGGSSSDDAESDSQRRSSSLV